ncbi:protein BLISTER [Tasmannia lanceolata]|uniref:protein BLISTER n=1 Tax=Tasmannia lanceolata TaxID=3420 RepID=UPI004063086C
MASTQVLPNSSRKQDHLEAGKRRLEEFRKKKAEGRAKKAASTGQLQSADVSQYQKLPQENEKLKLLGSDGPSYDGGGISGTEPSGSVKEGPVMTYDNKPISPSQSIDLGSSNGANASSTILANNYNAFYEDLVEKPTGYQEPKWYDGYDRWRGEKNAELSSYSEIDKKLTHGFTTDQPITFDPINEYPNIDGSNHHSSFYSLGESRPEEKEFSLKEYSVKDLGMPNVSSTGSLAEKSATDFMQSKGGFIGTSASTSALYEDDSIHPTAYLKESASKVDRYMDGSVDFNSASLSNMGGWRISGAMDHHPNLESAPGPTSEPVFSNSSLNLKGSLNQIPRPTIMPQSGTSRSRPSFLDSLNVSKVSSVSHLPFPESGKVEPFVSSNSSKVHSAEILTSSYSQPSLRDPDALEPLVNLRTPDFQSKDKSSLHSSASVNNNGELLRNGFKDDFIQMNHAFPSPEKDDDFAALEQHIEDLTQEKFSLQRALEASRALAESLANENSSLTDSFNQQGTIVYQLKSDMERLEKEIRDQLTELEDVHMKFTNEHLERNAANERANILASEIMELETKATRLRSNELKLERELEKSIAEITSYKRKVSSLNKECRDLQSTVDALKEEKKLLQSKLRKALANGKVIDTSKTPVSKDASTSTEDLGVEDLLDAETSVSDATPSTSSNDVQENRSSIVPSGNIPGFPLPAEGRQIHLQYASGAIPPDQMRMIGNINYLISELALEKEGLTRALEVESSNISKLKELNKELSQKLEAQTQRLELLTAQNMANKNILARPSDSNSLHDSTEYADEGDEVVERVLGWIMKLFPGGPTKRRTSKLL